MVVAQRLVGNGSQWDPFPINLCATTIVTKGVQYNRFTGIYRFEHEIDTY